MLKAKYEVFVGGDRYEVTDYSWRAGKAVLWFVSGYNDVIDTTGKTFRVVELSTGVPVLDLDESGGAKRAHKGNLDGAIRGIRGDVLDG